MRLTEERWGHIAGRHPEMADQREHVLETVAEPDMIRQGDASELLAIRFYERTPLTRKHLVVTYRERSAGSGFIVTASFARRPSAGRVVTWRRSTS